jgi:hypothetical protein
MASYQGVKGYKVQSTASDPSNPTIGQVWYNTTSDVLKYRTTIPGSNVFSSGGNLPATRTNGGGSPAGSSTAALQAEGYNPSPPAGFVNTSFEYDGSTWTAGGTTVRSPVASTSGIGDFGTQTAALICGGGNPYTTTVQEYDGTSWASANALPVDKSYMGSSGTQVAGLISMGYNAPDQTDTQPGSQEYDGTNWTSGGNCNTGSYLHVGFGVQTAAGLAGGYNPSTAAIARVEEYDGTSWTTVNALPGANYSASATGIQTSALYMGGTSPAPATVDTALEYDGTNWSAGGNMTTAREGAAGQSGTSILDSIIYGGSNSSGGLSSTEEYGAGAPTAATKTVTGA